MQLNVVVGIKIFRRNDNETGTQPRNNYRGD
jgi:hypothetical protein